MSEAWELEVALDRFAAQDEPYPCWLETDDEEDPDDYCPDCAEQAAVERPGFRVICYGYAAEHDGCRHCSKCGKLLAYVLTDYGVAEELEHFLACPPKAPLDKEVAAHISRIIQAAPENAEALALASAAVALIPQPSAPPCK